MAGSHNQDSSWKNVTNAAQLGLANQKHRPRGGSRDRPGGQGQQRGDNWQQGLGLSPHPLRLPFAQRLPQCDWEGTASPPLPGLPGGGCIAQPSPQLQLQQQLKPLPSPWRVVQSVVTFTPGVPFPGDHRPQTLEACAPSPITACPQERFCESPSVLRGFPLHLAQALPPGKGRKGKGFHPG